MRELLGSVKVIATPGAHKGPPYGADGARPLPSSPNPLPPILTGVDFSGKPSRRINCFRASEWVNSPSLAMLERAQGVRKKKALRRGKRPSRLKNATLVSVLHPPCAGVMRARAGAGRRHRAPSPVCGGYASTRRSRTPTSRSIPRVRGLCITQKSKSGFVIPKNACTAARSPGSDGLWMPVPLSARPPGD